jgi:hypothetical protein
VRVTNGRALTGAGIVTFGLGLAAWRAWTPGPDRPAGFLILNGALLLVGLGLLTAGGLRPWSRRSAESLQPRPSLGHPEPPGYPLLGVVLGTGLTALGSHVAVVFLGAVVTAWSAWLLTSPAARPPTPVAPTLTLALIPTYWLLDTIAGPVSLGMQALSDVPLSPLAERLVASLMLAVAWAMSGLWPFHRQLAGALSGPTAALLLYRVGAGAAPDGLVYWRTIAFPVLVIGLWHAALTGRLQLVAIAGGLLGLLSLEASGIAGGFGLLAAAIGLEMLSRTQTSPALARIGVTVLAAWGGIEALTGALRVEVVYSVLAAVGVGVIPVTAGSNGRGYIWRDETGK